MSDPMQDDKRSGPPIAGTVSVAHLVSEQQKHTDVTMELCSILIKTNIMDCWIQGVSLSHDIVNFKRLVAKKAKRVLVDDYFLNIT
jgi:hypothetical protein